MALLAVSKNKPFVIKASQAQEFKKEKNDKKSTVKIKKMADAFSCNNLVKK